ncbi:MAG: lipopolysaccharide assembly protein LapA domain-containing protein [Desulfovibrio sp.]|jgi:hypothetical protein|nr:lipopolysaccharide assembly protein LapA domain-containing protein [Desulfovibrio sp.]
MRLIKIILLILFFICSIVFFIQNTATLTQPLPLRFDPLPSFTEEVVTPSPLAWSSDGVPLYLVVLITFACGVFFSSFFFVLERVRNSLALIGKKRQIRSLERERDRLKADLVRAEERLKTAEAKAESPAAEPPA